MTEFCVVGYYFFGVRIIEYDLKAVISLSVCGGEKHRPKTVFGICVSDCEG